MFYPIDSVHWESTQLVNISYGFFSLFFPTIYVNFKTDGLVLGGDFLAVD